LQYHTYWKEWKHGNKIRLTTQKYLNVKISSRHTQHIFKHTRHPKKYSLSIFSVRFAFNSPSEFLMLHLYKPESSCPGSWKLKIFNLLQSYILILLLMLISLTIQFSSCSLLYSILYFRIIGLLFTLGKTYNKV
jgi:hypothetical protein